MKKISRNIRYFNAILLLIAGAVGTHVYNEPVWILLGAGMCMVLAWSAYCDRDKRDWEAIATVAMLDILNDSGALNRVEPIELDSHHHKMLAQSFRNFFEKNPKLPVDSTIKNLCIGDQDENKLLYGHMTGFHILHTDLNLYFDSI